MNTVTNVVNRKSNPTADFKTNTNSHNHVEHVNTTVNGVAAYGSNTQAQYSLFFYTTFNRKPI